MYYGNLTNGSIRFSITPASLLLNESYPPYGIDVVNPRVINVQAYWKGVGMNDWFETYVKVAPPYMLYPDNSGVGTSYYLPMLNSSTNPLSYTKTFGECVLTFMFLTLKD